MFVEGVAGMGLTDGVGGLASEKVRVEMLIEWKEQVLADSFADGGVVDDHEVVAGGEVGERRVGKLLERSLVPGDGDAGVELREALSRGNHRKKAAGMVPGYAGKFYHGVDDDGFTVCSIH